MSKQEQTPNLREPVMGEYGGETQWNCQWPGCEFDTLSEADWVAHIDPATGAHREPIGTPGELPQPLGAAERAELDALRAEKAASADAAAATKAAAKTTTTTTTAAPAGDQAKGA